MTRTEILVDTNVYLRLAQSLHPLLGHPFGEKSYCLRVLPELEKEYLKNPRLRSSFSWFEEAEYAKNRKNVLRAGKTERTEIEGAYEFILEESYRTDSSASRVDILCLSYAYVLGIPLVTDDSGMTALGRLYGITIWSTVELLHLMLSENRVDMPKIRETVAYLRYIRDFPRHLAEEYVRFFKEEPPE